MEQIKSRLKELYPKRIDQADFLGVDYYDLTKKLRTVNNKIEWLKTFLKPINLTIQVVELSKKEDSK